MDLSKFFIDRPGLDLDPHRGAAGADDPGIDAEHVPDPDRPQEGHAVDGHGDDAPLRRAIEEAQAQEVRLEDILECVS